MQVREVVAAAVRPVLIAVCRKELTGIRLKRDLVPLEISPLERRGRQSLKSVGIDDDVLGVEPKHVVVEQEVRVRPSCALGLERVAGGVQCLRETIARGRGVDVTPEHFHDLFAMEHMGGIGRDQLQQRLGRSPLQPGALGNDALGSLDAEAP